jgi:hypothetical protein
MSSTNRNSIEQRKKSHDYYVTPHWMVREFLNAWNKDTGIIDELKKPGKIIVDACAGGDDENEMSYPCVLSEFNLETLTIDIREDSRAMIKHNYLTLDIGFQADLIITNPPFMYAIEIIEKALNDCVNNGYVVMLLRLNYFGAQKRTPWFKQHMPIMTYVHSRRAAFNPDYPTKTDSIEYMHAIWQKGNYPKKTLLDIIEHK